MEECQYIVVAVGGAVAIEAISKYDDETATSVSEKDKLPFVFHSKIKAIELAYRLRVNNASVIRIK